MARPSADLPRKQRAAARRKPKRSRRISAEHTRADCSVPTPTSTTSAPQSPAANPEAAALVSQLSTTLNGADDAVTSQGLEALAAALADGPDPDGAVAPALASVSAERDFISPNVESDHDREAATPDPASEVARALGVLVPALPDDCATELRRLLGHDLAAPSAAEVRAGRLGLLMQLVADGNGVVPTTEQYIAAREAELARGKQWPSHPTLIRHFLTWPGAVVAAMLLHRDGSAARGPSTRRHVRRRGDSTPEQRQQVNARYSAPEVCTAIAGCADALGDWPDESLYFEYRRVARMLARHAKTLDALRLPQRRAIDRLYGDFEAARAAARDARARGLV